MIFPFILFFFATQWTNRNLAFSIFELALSGVLNVNYIMNKNKTELKTENPTYTFRDTNLVLQLI